MDFSRDLDDALKGSTIHEDISRRDLIFNSVNDKEAFVSKNGALAVLTEPESTGRSPKDTYIVKRDEIVDEIDWDSPNNIALSPEVFESILRDAIEVIRNKKIVYNQQGSRGRQCICAPCQDHYRQWCCRTLHRQYVQAYP